MNSHTRISLMSYSLVYLSFPFLWLIPLQVCRRSDEVLSDEPGRQDDRWQPHQAGSVHVHCLQAEADLPQVEQVLGTQTQVER